MGCNCGNKNRDVAYEVRYKDGHVERFTSVTDAQAAIRAAKGGTLRPVKASTPV